MKTLAVSVAEENFGELIDMAQSEPVRLQRQGRDVAVVLSAAEFIRLSETAQGVRRPIGSRDDRSSDRQRLISQAQAASRALKDSVRERAAAGDLEDIQAGNADALRP